MTSSLLTRAQPSPGPPCDGDLHPSDRAVLLQRRHLPPALRGLYRRIQRENTSSLGVLKSRKQETLGPPPAMDTPQRTVNTRALPPLLLLHGVELPLDDVRSIPEFISVCMIVSIC